MGNLGQKRFNRVDDDIDFGASFVLSDTEVHEALAGETTDGTPTLAPTARSSARSPIYTAVAIAAALLILVISLLAL